MIFYWNEVHFRAINIYGTFFLVGPGSDDSYVCAPLYFLTQIDSVHIFQIIAPLITGNLYKSNLSDFSFKCQWIISIIKMIMVGNLHPERGF